ncbi:MAG: hypothetical protein R2825_02815 [Saprospiraceae bacterium]
MPKSPMAVGTAAHSRECRFCVGQPPTATLFKGVFHAKSVSKGKPDPEILRKQLLPMNLPTSECLIFEDSVTGGRNGKRGQCPLGHCRYHSMDEFLHFDHIIRIYIDDYVGVVGGANF